MKILSEKLKGVFENPGSWHKLELAKNKDNTMKDFLVSANEKFRPDSGVDDLNVLLVACGDRGDVQRWWHYLYAPEGLFTSKPFHPPEEYQLVDVVLLTNLKYLHEDAPQFHDWTLRDAFILPCINSHRLRSLRPDSIEKGLSVFDHHLTRFAKYAPVPRADFPDRAMDQVKVIHYVGHLDKSERDRFFPVKPKNHAQPIPITGAIQNEPE